MSVKHLTNISLRNFPCHRIWSILLTLSRTVPYIVFLISLICLSEPGFCKTGASFQIVISEPEKITIEARGNSLKEILDEIHDKQSVRIIGLEHREADLVTFSSQAKTPEILLKRFLRYLGEYNYALEFTDKKLVKISVLPASKNKMSSLPPRRPEPRMPPRKEKKQDFITVVKVQGIVEDSQAAEAGLMEDDIVVEYDGIEIENSQQLVREVKKREDQESVNLTVTRDNQPMSFFLKGGTIGIRINTIRIPKNDEGEGVADSFDE